jgi:hypothetical protein
MSTDEAKTPKGGGDDNVRPLRRMTDDSATRELTREAQIHNRKTVRRVAEDESSRCLPRLHRAVLDVELGVQVLTMARFGGADEEAEAMAEALEQLEAAVRMGTAAGKG